MQATLELLAGSSGFANESAALQSQSDSIFHDACSRLQSKVNLTQESLAPVPENRKLILCQGLMKSLCCSTFM